MRRPVTSRTRSSRRCVRTHGTPTGRDPIRIRASAGRQLETFERFSTRPAGTTGEGSARLLDRIPDVALRLFAEIEFAAGIAGLEQVGGITREKVRGD